MTPEVELLSNVQYSWISFRATLDKVAGVRPGETINRLPIELSEDAKVLLYVCALAGQSIDQPIRVLELIPQQYMGFLHYSFLIACDRETWNEFQMCTRAQTMVTECLDYYFVVASGTLDVWYNTIITHLGRDWGYCFGTRILIGKIMVTLERRGLQAVFNRYRKKMLKDNSFLLEYRK